MKSNGDQIDRVLFYIKDAKLKTILKSHFESAQSGLDDVKKATYAYHVDHLSSKDGHNFPVNKRPHITNLTHLFNGDASYVDTTPCVWCGRSRYDVRWDSLPGECQNRPVQASISDVILEEERRYLKLVNAAKTEIPKILNRKFEGVVSANSLFFLHTTHGYDIECVMSVMGVDVKRSMIDEYDRLMESHSRISNTFKGSIKGKTAVQIEDQRK